MEEKHMHNTIVVGLDGSEASREAVRWAAGQSQSTGDRLLVVHAFRVDGISRTGDPTAEPGPLRTATESVHRTQATRWLRDALSESPAIPYSLRLEVTEGRWQDVIGRIAADRASLVVLGSSASSRALTSLRLPVVLVPAPLCQDTKGETRMSGLRPLVVPAQRPSATPA
jgi:nucleotide-binding universal stress UspA family protein